jgi:hypothetical protein
MFIVLTPEDLRRLRPDILREMLSHLGQGTISAAATGATVPPGAEDMNFTGVVDLMPEQVAHFMAGIKHERNIKCLRVIAEHGPVVDAKLFGIENYSHFQASMTKRIRTITGDENASLLTWAESEKSEEGKPITYYYAVSVITYESLRKYFGLMDEEERAAAGR